ncbi:MAG: toxin-antitoxin system HicB family antitoxin [bacterium]
MKSYSIRGIDKELDKKIKEYAKNNNMSINQWILSVLRKITGLEQEKIFKEYHDLDFLAGGWSEQDLNEFNQATSDFRKIDPDLWE